MEFEMLSTLLKSSCHQRETRRNINKTLPTLDSVTQQKRNIPIDQHSQSKAEKHKACETAIIIGAWWRRVRKLGVWRLGGRFGFPAERPGAAWPGVGFGGVCKLAPGGLLGGGGKTPQQRTPRNSPKHSPSKGRCLNSYFYFTTVLSVRWSPCLTLQLEKDHLTN